MKATPGEFKTIRIFEKIKVKKQMSAAQIIILGFFMVIATGSLLLTLPISSQSGNFTSLEVASFTAVSATCVTGLVIEDTILYWSPFGQVVILSMIQIGGLGFMTLALLMSMLLKRTITPRQRIIAAQSMGVNTNEGTVKLVRRVLAGTLIMESLGALVLATQFIPIFGFANGLYRSIFHSVSAFCNAGFDVLGDYSGAFTNLIAFRENYVVNITIMLLIIVGGIGFVVWNDIYERIKTNRRISVYTKFVIIVTLILIFGGTLLIFCFDYYNPKTLASLPLDKKLLASMFQSVTTRTAGFCTTDNTLFTQDTIIVSIILMFIGGASGSTAGGVKVGTAGLIVYAMARIAMGNTEIILFKRKISNNNILRAMAVIGICLTLVLTVAFIICSVEDIDFLAALFECASAMGTVGLSLSLTPSLSLISHLLLMMLMFFGRIGILTITFSIMLNITQQKQCISYAETNMLVG